LPFPEQKDEGETREQYVCAALDRYWNDSRPRPLKPLPRHHAVLDGKQSEQRGIDRQCLREGHLRPRVHRFRDGEISDETNRVQERSKERQVTHDSIEERCNSAIHVISLQNRGRNGQSHLLTLGCCETKICRTKTEVP